MLFVAVQGRPMTFRPPLTRVLALVRVCWISLREAPSPHDKPYETFTQKTQVVSDGCHRGSKLLPRPARRQVNAQHLLREVHAAEEQLHVGAGILRLFSEGRVWND